MKKRIISFLLAIVMIVGMIPIGALPVFAEDTDPKWFLYEENDTGITITKYNPDVDLDAPTSVIIPSEIDGKRVTAIGDGAFTAANLQGVVIPEGVTAIGDGAFIGNALPGGAVFPESLTYIGKEAFRNCGAFVMITIPKGVKYIGDSAFSDIWFQEVVFEGQPELGTDVFKNCGYDDLPLPVYFPEDWEGEPLTSTPNEYGAVYWQGGYVKPIVPKTYNVTADRLEDVSYAPGDNSYSFQLTLADNSFFRFNLTVEGSEPESGKTYTWMDSIAWGGSYSSIDDYSDATLTWTKNEGGDPTVIARVTMTNYDVYNIFYNHTHSFTSGTYKDNGDGTYSQKCACCDAYGAPVQAITETYLTKAPTVTADGTCNQRAYYITAEGQKVILNEKVLDQDQAVTFADWYLRTMVQYKEVDENYDIRFISMLNGECFDDGMIADYDYAGFTVTISGESTDIKTYAGYTSFLADGQEVSIEDYSDNPADGATDFFFLANTAFAKTEIEDSTEITVQPFVKLMNSEAKLTGKAVTFTLAQLKGN